MNVDLIITGFVILAAAAFAWWYLRRASIQRAKEDERRAADDAAAASLAAGLAVGDRPIIDDTERGQRVQRILDDGLAFNSQHVTPRFRQVWWRSIDAGESMAVAFRKAMNATFWRSGSQGQVFDRLKSEGIISDGDRNRLKAEAERNHPDGYGTYEPSVEAAAVQAALTPTDLGLLVEFG